MSKYLKVTYTTVILLFPYFQIRHVSSEYLQSYLFLETEETSRVFMERARNADETGCIILIEMSVFWLGTLEVCA